MLHTLRFSLQNAVYFIMLLFGFMYYSHFYIQGVLKFKCKTPVPKVKAAPSKPALLFDMCIHKCGPGGKSLGIMRSPYGSKLASPVSDNVLYLSLHLTTK